MAKQLSSEEIKALDEAFKSQRFSYRLGKWFGTVLAAVTFLALVSLVLLTIGAAVKFLFGYLFG